MSQIVFDDEPMPTFKYGFLHQLKIHGSCYIPNASPNFYRGAHSYAKKIGIRIKSKRDVGGLRIWRML